MEGACAVFSVRVMAALAAGRFAPFSAEIPEALSVPVIVWLLA